MLWEWQGLNEHISNVVSGLHISNAGLIMSNELTDPMTFNAKVLGTWVVGSILNVGDCLEIVAINVDQFGARQAEFIKEMGYPKGMLGSRDECHGLGLGGRESDPGLFLR